MHSTFKTLHPLTQNPMKKSAICANRFIATALAIFFSALITVTGAQAASTVGILDARERGATVSGVAKGTLTPTFDEATKKDVLEFDYSMTQDANVIAWVKNFIRA